MPDPIYRITNAGFDYCNGTYEFLGLLHNHRPYWKHPENQVYIWWGNRGYSRWVIGNKLEYYDSNVFYEGCQEQPDWRCELLKCAWSLGGHPETAMPLPTLSLWAPPLGPTATNLLTERLISPTRIMDLTPTFSWTYVPGDCPGVQAAYRILVATAPELLVPGETDLWDSGIVETVAAVVTYAGQPLPDDEMIFIQVRVRDNDGRWSI